MSTGKVVGIIAASVAGLGAIGAGIYFATRRKDPVNSVDFSKPAGQSPVPPPRPGPPAVAPSPRVTAKKKIGSFFSKLGKGAAKLAVSKAAIGGAAVGTALGGPAGGAVGGLAGRYVQNRYA